MKKCIACGMPMKKAAEFAMGDESKDYCRYCAREDGTMHSFEEKREGMIAFIIRTQGVAPDVAREAADQAMRRLPAWKEYYEG